MKKDISRINGIKEIYKELYDHLPGFAYRVRIADKNGNGSYTFNMDIASSGCSDIFGLPEEQMTGPVADRQEKIWPVPLFMV